MLKEIWSLLHKAFISDFRDRFSLISVVVYLLAMTFIIFAAIQNISPMIWNSLLWIIVIFIATNALGSSFIEKNSNTRLLYYTMVEPISFLLAKIIYNFIWLLALSALSYALLVYFSLNPVLQWSWFVYALVLGSFGMSVLFTFNAAITGSGESRQSMVAILTFPLLLPILFLTIRLTAQSIGIINDSDIFQDVLLLIAIDLLLVGLTIILYPSLWRD